MNYTPEQLRELASCYEGCHGELGSLRDLMRANADKIEECERLRVQLSLAHVAFLSIANGIPNPQEYAKKCAESLKESK